MKQWSDCRDCMQDPSNPKEDAAYFESLSVFVTKVSFVPPASAEPAASSQMGMACILLTTWHPVLPGVCCDCPGTLVYSF